MPTAEIKLTRLSAKLSCQDCKKELPFGTFAHYHEPTNQAICIECGVKRGWENKDVVKSIIKKLELQKDISALTARRKTYADALSMVKEKIDLHLLGEQDKVLEGELVKLMAKLQDYINKVASASEKQAFKEFLDSIEESKRIQKTIREIIRRRYFMLERDVSDDEELLAEENASRETSALKEIA